ncbi:hypothetical protein LR48_Vigan04g054700 [Vigna angularis]|uniref:Uncharacterized protein n=1 Tax=Phaseolus angularis TaxID=3914 RepID=A0A0L9UCU8_PHAAN|nr:hypothetical protein LR48_Vigan04g054700 [Vigna angularis]
MVWTSLPLDELLLEINVNTTHPLSDYTNINFNKTSFIAIIKNNLREIVINSLVIAW